MKLSRVFAVLAIAALVVGAMAQGGAAGNVGGRQGGGRGGFGGGQRGMMGGGNPGMILIMPTFGRGGGGGAQGGNLREDIITDIKLTDDQKTKVDALRTKQQERIQAMMSSGERPSREEMQKAMEEATKELNAILTADQQKRLVQIGVQIAGPRAVSNADTAKALGVTEEQKKQIDDLMAKQQEANRALFEKVQSGELDRDAMQEKMQANTKILTDEINKILTDAQKAKLKEMAGPEFKRTTGN